ncbi:lipopolysaccharide N-acetylglucosaminyltransferase [Polaribacter irgensii 23-P]|uniref:Lipopolysaccharide N-acetylglucosaminyltransferase n=1 Tax=Polaribacter irgensii 23-P TaxID=313594 RepID=A4BYM2_9FLAO|nr:glycosyltransferase family 4 protein [Polaribacter irgensii]EAR12265.1 lipopolysaccharide N-acetylglucosaminyltransferase [Polaribacter irgensii 23-P]
MRKKVIIITNGTLPVPAIFGGAAENLTQVLLEINEDFNDFDFTVFSIGKNKIKSKEFLAFKNTNFVFINEDSFFFKLNKIVKYLLNKKFNNRFPNQFLSTVLKYKKELKNADLILISNNPYYGKHLKEIVSCPIYLHLHNDYINANQGDDKIRLLNYFDKVIGVSNFIKKSVLKVTPKSCKVSYVYNGIDLNRFTLFNEVLESYLKKKYNLNKEDTVFIYSGRMQESKGIVFLLESFLTLLKKHKNIKLLFVGGTVYYNSKINEVTKNLIRRVESSLASEHVFFTGFVDYKYMHHYYKISNVAVLPSIETEAFGLTSIESQAAGLPVIVSDVGGMSETINKDCGFIVNVTGDLKSQLVHFMDKLIEDETLRKEMSKKALLNAQKFSNSFFYKQIKSELNEL